MVQLTLASSDVQPGAFADLYCCCVHRYTSNVTNSTYVWNTGFSTFDEAEETCNSYGGHLAAWNNAEEQQEVEVGGQAGLGSCWMSGLMHT